MPKKEKNITGKILIILSGIFTLFILLSILLWLFALPLVVKSKAFINLLDTSLKKIVNLDLTVEKPELKTSLKPVISFSVDNLVLKDKTKILIELKDFNTKISF